MRKFKELRKIIAEDATDYSGYIRKRVGPQDGDNGLDFNQNLAQLNPAHIDRINTFLGAMSAKPYLDPNQALKEAQSKLSTIGLQFTLNSGDDLRMEGERVYPLSLFGGSFGADGTTYGYKPADDNIERKIGHKLGLLVMSQSTSTGMTTLKAEIVPM
jgi:hypothetical protein